MRLEAQQCRPRTSSDRAAACRLSAAERGANRLLLLWGRPLTVGFVFAVWDDTLECIDTIKDTTGVPLCLLGVGFRRAPLRPFSPRPFYLASILPSLSAAAPTLHPPLTSPSPHARPFASHNT